jgi:hypothetical protein
MHVEVWLYGPLSRFAGDQARPGYGCLNLDLVEGASMRELLSEIGFPLAEKGITFVNGELTDMPGLAADLDRPMREGDRVAFFHDRSMWPFQYRFGASMSPELHRAMLDGEGGALRHFPGQKLDSD